MFGKALLTNQNWGGVILQRDANPPTRTAPAEYIPAGPAVVSSLESHGTELHLAEVTRLNCVVRYPHYRYGSVLHQFLPPRVEAQEVLAPEEHLSQRYSGLYAVREDHILFVSEGVSHPIQDVPQLETVRGGPFLGAVFQIRGGPSTAKQVT